MYSISDHRRMVADSLRTQAYAEALRRTVGPQTAVVDIGTGTGIFALLACRFGARRVYAIEPDDIIQVARDLASANGCADRISFIQDISTRVSLPERAQVIVSDLRGVLPLSQRHLPSIIDARDRLLAPGGTLIPQRDTLWAAPVEASDVYALLLAPWDVPHYDLDFQPARHIAANTWSKARVRPDQLLTAPQCWATLDYGSIDRPEVSTDLRWAASRAGTGHGVCVWFDTTLIDGVGFTTGPGGPELIYGSGFFPWPEPVRLAAGDVITVALSADLVGDDYVWRWNTRIWDQGDSGRVKATFAQSNFLGTPLPSARLHARAASHVPSLSEHGQIDRAILTLMDGNLSVAEIARQVSGRFPARFPDWKAALGHVSTLSERYGRSSDLPGT